MVIFDFSQWTTNDFVAWWGAVIATAALLWNIITALRSGPRIKVRATPNMQIFPHMPPYGDKTYISVTAVNKGTAPTTITNFAGYHAKNLFGLFFYNKRFFKKYRQHFIISTGMELGTPLPHVLRSGEEWSGMIDQESIAKDMAGGYLYVGVIHNQRHRPIYVRVRLDKI